MPQETSTLIALVAGMLTTFGGVCLGAWLAKSGQRKQWILDNRKEECRELLTALSQSLTAELSISDDFELQSPQQQQQVDDTQANYFRVTHDRIFIANELHSLDISLRWINAISEYAKTKDVEKLDSVYRSISDEIIKLALKYDLASNTS